MSGRRRDDWDDWDDEPVVVERKPSVVSTRRILIGLVVVAVLAVVVGGRMTREPMRYSEVPDALLGTWTCDHPEHSDLWIEFERERVSFGTGGTGSNNCRVLGVDEEAVGNLRQFVVLYKDMAGRKHRRELLLDASGESLRFTDRPALAYSRYR